MALPLCHGWENKCRARLASSAQETRAIGSSRCRKIPEHGAREIVHLLMCLLHKHEDLIASPRTHMIKASM